MGARSIIMIAAQIDAFWLSFCRCGMATLVRRG